MRYLILLFLLFGIFNLNAQQNLIKNGSFEERDLIIFGNPTPSVLGAFHDDIKDWDDDYQGGAHSPDWFKMQNTFIFIEDEQGNGVVAQDQAHYAGMLRGELMEQKLVSKLKKDKSYKLIFYVRLVGEGFSSSISNVPGQLNYGHPFTDNYPEAFIDILLSDRKIKYSSADATGPCNVEQSVFDGFVEKSTPFVTAASIPINIQSHPKEFWHKVEVYLAQGLEIDNLDWIALELRHSQTQLFPWVDPQGEPQEHCTKPYLLIDNVQLYEQTCEECKNCSYKDGCIDVDIFNNDVSSICPEFTNLENVSSLHIEIATPQGLIRVYDIENPPSQFSWDLKNDFGITVLPQSYDVTIKASNDCQVKVTTKSITVNTSTLNSCTNTSTFFPVSRADPPNGQCCGEDLYLSNIVISEDHIYRANKIIVGPDVTILSGVIVEFHAETEIDISPDLTVELGADWFAYIDENCVNDDIGRVVPISNDNTIDDEIVLDKNNVGDTINPKIKKDIDILIYPNPSTGIINISRIDVGNNTLVQVFDMSGRLLKTKILINSQTQLRANAPKFKYLSKKNFFKILII
jgi:hypothetical protein